MPQGSHTRDCLVNPVTGRAVKRGTPTFKRIMQYKRGEMTLEELTNILRSKARKSKGAEEIIPADPIERFNYYEKKWKEAIAISAELEEKHGEQSKRYQAAEREVDRLAALRRKARQEAQPARARAQAQEARARASPAAREEPEEKKEPEKKPEKEKQLEAMRKAMQTARERAEKKKEDSFEREKRAKRARMKEARKKKTTTTGTRKKRCLDAYEGAKDTYEEFLDLVKEHRKTGGEKDLILNIPKQFNKFKAKVNRLWNNRPPKFKEEFGYYDCKKELDELDEIMKDIASNSIWDELNYKVAARYGLLEAKKKKNN
jgi:hypothetical protein